MSMILHLVACGQLTLPGLLIDLKTACLNCKKSDVFIFIMLAMYSMFKTINYYYYNLIIKLNWINWINQINWIIRIDRINRINWINRIARINKIDRINQIDQIYRLN